MKKRILLLATVAALMAVMLVAMASAALAIPPGSSELGCEGGQNNANHATNQTGISDQSKSHLAPGTQDNAGLDKATDNTFDNEHCRNEPPEHPHD